MDKVRGEQFQFQAKETVKIMKKTWLIRLFKFQPKKTCYKILVLLTVKLGEIICLIIIYMGHMEAKVLQDRDRVVKYIINKKNKLKTNLFNMRIYL